MTDSGGKVFAEVFRYTEDITVYHRERGGVILNKLFCYSAPLVPKNTWKLIVTALSIMVS